jgi:hypothetical protein
MKTVAEVANFVIALAVEIIRGSKSAKIGHRFNVPYEDV